MKCSRTYANTGYTHTPNVPSELSARRATARWVSGYTLIELIVAIGLFSIVSTLASGAYLVMIGVNRQAQAISTGIDNLSFALETMTREIRTGTGYGCGSGGDCSNGGESFSFKNSEGDSVTYSKSSEGEIQKTKDGGTTQNSLTDSSVNITSLKFYAYGTQSGAPQPRVTIVVSGKISSGSGGKVEEFTVQTGATMRGTDL